MSSINIGKLLRFRLTLVEWAGLLAFVSLMMFSQLAAANVKKELEALGEHIEQALAAEELQKLKKVINTEAFDAQVLSQLTVSATERESIQTALSTILHANGLFAQIFNGDPNAKPTIKFVGVKDIGGMLRPVLRVDLLEGGVNYIELICEKSPSKGYLVTDMYLAVTGQTFSSTMADSLSMMLNLPSGLFAKVLNKRGSQAEVADIIQTASQKRRAGDMVGMYKTLKRLPTNVQEEELVAFLLASSALALSEETYMLELNRFSNLFGDSPQYAMFL